MSKISNAQKPKRKSLRLVVQFFFFILVLLIVINKALVENGQGIPFLGHMSLHAICPFGGIESLYSLFTAGVFVQKIHASSMVLTVAVFIISILFGPAFCSWICPFGTVQEFVGKIGRKIFKRRYNNFIPVKLDYYLRYIRYFVLGLVLYNTAVTAKLVFQNYDPYYALFNFFTNEVAITAYIALIMTLVLSLFIERPFCKYLCPYGSILGLFNYIRIFKIRRAESTCINCGACDVSCPMNIKVSQKNSVNDHQCISCMQCTSEAACPIANTVTLSTKLKQEAKKYEG
ncbi:4Fe-4S binding protein [Clostridium sp. 'deep sea']|uniref:4Fe-4S binding protein n=1 Tax=Clostridium sp. 'deep sea' TaxID=2779445 RepID=UPI0018965E9C|nr:4Fe-4S binding protein [Clostridium sp. 'deep sea']QOR36675.1 4Fe-4S binding protein [Clostridium sp. 'deep sea']